ncbi:hypothetical protein [Algoriphagus sanaruensis]|uniref:Uncharacterized protein n=1 Tax=Algoriphagus sanaruensis TaxID=1727163 RepID=A0A142EPR6_9BACT|nr:hypothetical protein [Algoriphagus sanaruensis]AMQ57121.1 hypothetical protein AO498_11790 [Algoriphagus sanaruensis]
MRALIIWCFLLPIASFGQVSMEEFLESAFESIQIRQIDQQKGFLESGSYKMAPIRGLEFRTESNQLDPQRQDFALRISPANPWEINRNNAYFEKYQEVIDLGQIRQIKKLIQLRYDLIIDWVYLQDRKSLKDEEIKTIRLLIEILEAQRNSSFFDPENYAELKIDLIEKQAELQDLMLEEDVLMQRIVSFLPDAQSKNLDWNLDDLVSIERISNWIETHKAQIESEEVTYHRKLVELSKAEWELEKSNLNIGFLQAQYQQFRLAQDRKPWNIGLGIRLPIFNPNKGKMAEKKLDIFEAEGNLTQVQNEHVAEVELVKSKLVGLCENYFSIQNQLEDLDLISIEKNLNTLSSNNPAVNLRFQRNLLKSKNILARHQRDIYAAFIEYLSLTDALQQRPIVNYLGSDWITN